MTMPEQIDEQDYRTAVEAARREAAGAAALAALFDLERIESALRVVSVRYDVLENADGEGRVVEVALLRNGRRRVRIIGEA